MANTIGSIPEFTQDGEEPRGVKPNDEDIVDSPSTETPVETPSTDDEEVETPEPTDDGEEADGGEEPEPEAVPDEITALRREREALLGDIKSLRTERRELRGQPIPAPATPSLVVPQDKDDLSDIDPNELSTLRRVLKAEGYVKSTDVQGILTQEAQNDIRDQFLEDHPEYKPENDTDDLNWKALTAELGLYAQPKDKKTLVMLLNRAHKEVSGRVTKPVSKTQIEAQRRTVAKAGAGAGHGGGRTETKVTSPKIPENLRQHMHGFDDEDFA